MYAEGASAGPWGVGRLENVGMTDDPILPSCLTAAAKTTRRGSTAMVLATSCPKAGRLLEPWVG